jgi:hypothetical protein
MGDTVNSSLKQKLLAGGAVAALIAGGTMAAVTAARPAEHRRAGGGPLVTAAAYLGVSTSQLNAELKSGRSLAEIAAATSGRSASGLIDALVASDRARLSTAIATLPTRVAAQVDRAGGPAGQAALGPARYLGISPAQLRSERLAGKSLAQVANATSGRSAAGLIETIVTARKATLAARLAAGTLTQAQESARLAKLTSRVTSAVNATRAAGAARRARPRG